MWPAFRFAVLMFIVGGILYPLAMTGMGQVLFPGQANGSLIKNEQGQLVGSSLLGQDFSRPEYFHPRPSANSYDASNSSGSNYGATSQKLMDRVQQDIARYQKENTDVKTVPVDAVTASASGLDPDISLANAMIQAARVAGARHLDSHQVIIKINEIAEKPMFGFLGEPQVNVLQLNLALDREQVRK